MAENKDIYDIVKQTLEKIKNMADNLYKNRFANDNNELEDIVAVIQAIYNFMIKNNTLYINNGIDISINELNNQYNNMINGINSGDYILLADTLLYEISATLNYFIKVGRDIDE